MKRFERETLPVITEENEQEYWIKFKETSSNIIREAFIRKYAPLVKSVVRRISVSMSKQKQVDYDDLVSYGTLGLIDAIRKYNPTRDIKFKTYAYTRIRGSIYDELRNMDFLPRSIRKDIKEIERTREILEAKFSRNISPDEVASELGITMTKYNEIMQKSIESSHLSLNDIAYFADDSEGLSLVDTLRASDKTSPEHLAEREDVRKKIKSALEQLPQTEQQVLILYYYEELTLKEIGAVLEVSESRVSQLHTKAIQALRYTLSDIKKQLI